MTSSDLIVNNVAPVPKHDPLYVLFGKLVRGYRRRHEITQHQLGDRIGLTRTSITNIEQGRQKVLLHQIFQLADALQVNPEMLLPRQFTSETESQIEHKLPKNLRGPERDWIHRVVNARAQEEQGDDKKKQK